MSAKETLVEAAIRVLNPADPLDEARMGDSVAYQWLQGTITCPYDPSGHTGSCSPWQALQCIHVELVPTSLMPKLHKAGSLQSRQAIVHSLAHTESWAID